MDAQAGQGILSMVTGSGVVVQAVLFILIGLSFVSWAITIDRARRFRRARDQSNEFSAIFWETRNFARVSDTSARLSESPLSRVFQSGYKELAALLQESKDRTGTPLDTVERALRRAELNEAHRLERGVTFLATVASAAPFIGLFGTVWGIMNAFHGLSSVKNSTIQAVAPGISEALVATAVGLAAAIPAAVAYNYFAVDVRRFRESMNKFSDEFLTVARRYLAAS